MGILLGITSLLLLSFCTPGFSTHDGIVGGKVSIPHSRPYMVYIRNPRTKGACDGFLVREDFVMTAAHCYNSHLMVYLGVNDTNLLPEGIAVHPIKHPEFKNKPGYDIMLLQLKTPATLNKTVKTIALPKTESDSLEDCMVIGWGLEHHGKGPPSRVLKELNVTLLDSKNCLTKDTLCSKGSTGPAEGDSGGPLVCVNAAQGIVSFTEKLQMENTAQDTPISPNIFHGFMRK